MIALPETPQHIRLDMIVADPAYQPRVRGLDPEHLQRLRDSDPQSWPPIVLSYRSSLGKYILIDGFHRVAVAGERALETLPSFTTNNAGYEESFALNSDRRGLSLSMEDRKAFALWLYDTYPDMLNEDIARRAGVSGSTLKKSVAQRKAEASAPSPMSSSTKGAQSSAVANAAKSMIAGAILSRLLDGDADAIEEEIAAIIAASPDASIAANNIGCFATILQNAAARYE